ncbi:Phosphoserine phosphatase 1 [Rubrobacter xylanophilus DSM 9941]|nr:Phosphoserine phosphatase 1 [Rubrobacter xylanophilus DSM 9941]
MEAWFNLTAMPETLEMLLIRHGQSTANAKRIWQGQMEFPLSEEGRRQARHAGRTLAGRKLSAIYSSPLRRALETAEILARESGYAGEIVPLEGLTERRGGILEGTTHEERAARFPELLEKFLAVPEEERWQMVGAETDEEVLGRFEAAVAEILARHPRGGVVAVVSHGGAIRAFLRDRFGPGVLAGDLRAPNASITRILWPPDDAPRLLELASTSHLPEEPDPKTSTVE